jgi:diguanylate cyclase (GGDEF)-like protein
MTRPGFRRGRPGGGRAKAAETDGFLSTSLFSQAQIMHLMKNEFARARRHGMPVGCLLIQVDRLLQLADLHGAALRAAVRGAISRLVREKTRGSDLLGAANDDRYLLLLPHADLVATRVVAERLLEMFDEFDVAVDGRSLSLSLSIGITACDDQKTLFFDSLIAQAEAALEFATQNGGDQVVSFGETHLRAPNAPEPTDRGENDDE